MKPAIFVDHDSRLTSLSGSQILFLYRIVLYYKFPDATVFLKRFHMCFAAFHVLHSETKSINCGSPVVITAPLRTAQRSTTKPCLKLARAFPSTPFNSLNHLTETPHISCQARSQGGQGVMTPNEIDSGLRSRPLCTRSLCHKA